MGYIYSVTESSKPFVYLTVFEALKKLSEWTGYGLNVKNFEMWKIRHIDRDSGNDAIVFAEAAYLAYSKLSIRELRTYYPNAKIVVAGSDTKYYQMHDKLQVDHPAECDLWLDLMEECNQKYRYDFGMICEQWFWTISQSQIDYLSEFQKNTFREKKYDVISVLSPHTIERAGSYRKSMVDYLRQNGIRFTLGGNGQEDTNVIKTYERYLESWLTLGTTSHDNAQLGRSSKGWRDAVGIFLGVPLIYDNHPDATRMCGGSVPIYPYEDFPLLKKLIVDLIANQSTYKEILRKQQEWFSNLTIEKQFYRIFNKHGIINTNKCCPGD